jgi:glycosyltransferase involved in cell wall biosynthesis
MEQPKILFLDQSGKPGGAELCLLDIAKPLRDRCLVGLLADGAFRELLEGQQIPVQILTEQAIQIQKDSNLVQAVRSVNSLITPVLRVAKLSQGFDIIYANTQKALVVGAMASLLSRKPLVYHLHDIVSPDHFSAINRQIIITLANRASLVIANSYATQAAYKHAGGRSPSAVVYNGFDLSTYESCRTERSTLRPQLGFDAQFVIGHFSRLAPWKGQHILIEALQWCPQEVVAVFVGDALFGEQAYVAKLHQQIEQLGLGDRVKFLGFRSDVPPLMTACNLVVHTSTAPEPFGRVIAEAMLCGTPVIAADAGGAAELIEHGRTGWLSPPGDANKLADLIGYCYQNSKDMEVIADYAQQSAHNRFNLLGTNQQINHLLQQIYLE